MNLRLIMQEKFLERIISEYSRILSAFCSIKCGMVFMVSFFEIIVYRRCSERTRILFFFCDSIVIIIRTFPIRKSVLSWNTFDIFRTMVKLDIYFILITYNLSRIYDSFFLNDLSFIISRAVGFSLYSYLAICCFKF